MCLLNAMTDGYYDYRKCVPNFSYSEMVTFNGPTLKLFEKKYIFGDKILGFKNTISEKKGLYVALNIEIEIIKFLIFEVHFQKRSSCCLRKQRKRNYPTYLIGLPDNNVELT